VEQISDENGRTLLNANGSPNEKPQHAIPLAMHFPALDRATKQGPNDPSWGSSAMPRESLSVNLTGQRRPPVSFFVPGTVMIARGTGAGQGRPPARR